MGKENTPCEQNQYVGEPTAEEGSAVKSDAGGVSETALLTVTAVVARVFVLIFSRRLRSVQVGLGQKDGVCVRAVVVREGTAVQAGEAVPVGL